MLLPPAALGLAAITAAVALERSHRPERVEIVRPCIAERDLPDSGGLSGLLQDSALLMLDKAACGYGSTREELALALADPDEAERFEERYGENPRSADAILDNLFG